MRCGCGREFQCWTPDGSVPDELRVCIRCTARKAEEAGRRRKRAERQRGRRLMLNKLERMDAEVRRLSKLLGERARETTEGDGTE